MAKDCSVDTYYIKKVEKLIKDFNNDLITIKGKSVVLKENEDNLVLSLERLIMATRELLYIGYNSDLQNIYRLASDCEGITLEYKKGIYKLCLPCLLPKNGNYKSYPKSSMDDLIYYQVYKFLEEYKKEHDLVQIKEGVIVYNHIYDKNCKNLWNVRDNDNIEIKNITNIMIPFFGVDDSGLLMDIFNTASLDNANRTEVYFMEKKLFPNWHKKFTKQKKSQKKQVTKKSKTGHKITSTERPNL